MSDWTDRIVGDRMAVDGTFSGEVEASQFSRQEWGLIMTAVEFEIQGADDPDTATLVANTDNLDAVLPEMDRIAKMQRQAQGGGGLGGMGGGGGFLDSIRGALGLGNGSDRPDADRVAEAESLAQAYARKLQAHLENNGKWPDICAAASA